ncbi:hypothetical protein Efla_001086 [Eimeria flavescens]
MAPTARRPRQWGIAFYAFVGLLAVAFCLSAHAAAAATPQMHQAAGASTGAVGGAAAARVASLPNAALQQRADGVVAAGEKKKASLRLPAVLGAALALVAVAASVGFLMARQKPLGLLVPETTHGDCTPEASCSTACMHASAAACSLGRQTLLLACVHASSAFLLLLRFLLQEIVPKTLEGILRFDKLISFIVNGDHYLSIQPFADGEFRNYILSATEKEKPAMIEHLRAQLEGRLYNPDVMEEGETFWIAIRGMTGLQVELLVYNKKLSLKTDADEEVPSIGLLEARLNMRN